MGKMTLTSASDLVVDMTKKLRKLGKRAIGGTDKEQISLALGSSEARERALDLAGLTEHEQDDVNTSKASVSELSKDDAFHEKIEQEYAKNGRPEAIKRSERAVEVGAWKGQKQIRKSIQTAGVVEVAREKAAATETKEDDNAPHVVKNRAKDLVYDDGVSAGDYSKDLLDDLF